MSVSLRKIDGVDSVTVSLKEGLARITLKAGNAVTLSQLREVVKKNGFTPQQAAVRAEAEITGSGDLLRITIQGVDETFEVAGVPGGGANTPLQAGTAVQIEGVVPVPNDRQTATIRLTAIRPSDRK